MKHTPTDLRLATASNSVWLKHKMKLRRFCSLVRSLRRTRNDHSITCLLKFLLYNYMAKLKRIIFRLQNHLLELWPKKTVSQSYILVILPILRQILIFRETTFYIMIWKQCTVSWFYLKPRWNTINVIHMRIEILFQFHVRRSLPN